MPKEWREKISLANKGQFRVVKENASKRSIHLWVERHFGKPKQCQKCGKVGDGRYDWANKDHTYSRNIKDWMRLCKLCHWEYDKKHNNHVQNRRRTIVKRKYQALPVITKNCERCRLFHKLKENMLSVEIAKKFNVTTSTVCFHLNNHRKYKKT